MTSDDRGQYFVIDFLTGNMQPGEMEDLRQWLSQSEENRNYFTDMKDLWFSVVCDSEYEFDAEKAYEEFWNRINSSQAPGSRNNLRNKYKGWIKYSAAAVCAVILGATSFMIGKNSPTPHTWTDVVVQVPMGARTNVLLPDSTEVQLNAGTRMVYSQNYGIENRNIILNGEACFKVTHNEEMPLTVRSGEMKIQDVGTVFNIRNYNNDDTAIVTLIEGEVKVMLDGNKTQSNLIPDERLVFDKRDGSVRIDKTDATASTQWTTGTLLFDEEKLTDIAKNLERRYGVSITIKQEDLGNRRIYGNFSSDEQSITEIIDNICTVAGIRYAIEGKSITLY